MKVALEFDNGRRILRHRIGKKNKIILNRLLAETGTLKLPQLRAEKKKRKYSKVGN